MDNLNTALINLQEKYEAQPIIKALIQSLPIGAAADTVLSGYINKMKAEKMRAFFEQLANGDIELTEDLIKDDNFLHAYFATVNYVLLNRSKLKIKAFAEILKSLYRDQLNMDEFEDYEQIFNELSEREFLILSVKYEFEKHAASDTRELNPAQRTSTYWADFKNEIKNKMGIEADELNSMLLRVQRTGCFNKHKGYWDESHEEEGNTTPMFAKLRTVVSFEQ